MRLVASFLVLTACGSNPQANVVGTIGWSFNYRDWTKEDCAVRQSPSCTSAAIRACDNQPPNAAGRPRYQPISTVEITLQDPQNQLPPYVQEFDCEQGAEEVKGLVRQAYRLQLLGKTAAGEVLYQHRQDALDLSSYKSETFELRTVVGELNYFPSFPGSGDCPGDAETLRWSVRRAGETDVVKSGEQAACSGGLPEEVFMRDLPSNPAPNENGSYSPVDYDVTFEVLQGGGVRYCSEVLRTVFPGDSNFNSNQAVTAGACN